ncbi:MAG: prolyl oligopeptidase family serine peptidase [Opitutaceae bacterium]
MSSRSVSTNPSRLCRLLILSCLLPLGWIPVSGSRIPVEDLFRESQAAAFSLSPDGQYIALIGRNPKGKKCLYARNLETGATQSWTIDGGGNEVAEYSWISNERLVYRVSRYQYYFRGLYSVQRDRDTINQLDFEAVNIVVDPLMGRDSVLVLRRIGDGEITPFKSSLVEIDSVNGYPIETVWTYNDGLPLNTMTDLSGRVRLIQTFEKGEYQFRLRSQLHNGWSSLDFPHDVNLLSFGPSGETILLSHYFGKDHSGLYRYELDREQPGTLIYEDPDYDLHTSAQVILDVERKVPLGFRYQADHEKTVWFSPEMQQIQAICDHHNPDTINRIVSANLKAGRFLFQCYSDRQPSIYRMLDYGQRRITDLWPTRPQIDPGTMAPTESIQFVTRDALSIRGYLTRPISGSPPYPTVVMVHGGPWARDTWGFDPEVQFLANRGYAVLQINFRGSTGFGFPISERLKGDLEGMNNDLEDGVRWAIAQGHTDANRVGIMGGSFGGYAALYGVAFKPDLYKCAIGNVGVYDWPRHVDEKKGDLSNYVFDYYQDIWGEDYREHLEQVSPLYRAAQIKAPVFIAYGRDDRRVKPEQSKLMIAALKKAGNEPEVFSKSWEGHGFFDEDVQFGYYRAIEAFLKKNL